LGGRFLSIGECMVELSQAGDGLLRKGFAGDTLNTAWYARACLPADWAVDYCSAVGDDPLSAEMLAFFQSHGIGTEGVRRIPGKSAGLYLINLDNGERSFSYWRETSAARQLAADPAHLRRIIEQSDVLYFSGITLAILDAAAVDTLLAELRRAKHSGRLVVFDPNIRPRLWADRENMLATISAGAAAANLVLPSFDDEATHFGDSSIADTIARYHGLGAEKVLVKDGPAGATLSFGGPAVHVPAVVTAHVIDTTSAGDSFNGAFLSRYLINRDAQGAAAFAAGIAARVIGAHGALVDLGAAAQAA
jgi:2-dehydro-3-deoxygluconokinase